MMKMKKKKSFDIDLSHAKMGGLMIYEYDQMKIIKPCFNYYH